MRLKLAQQAGKAGVFLQQLEILDTVVAGQVQRDQRHERLDIRSTLLARGTDPPRNRVLQAGRQDKIQIGRQTAKWGGRGAWRITFVVERKKALWHGSFTSLVIG